MRRCNRFCRYCGEYIVWLPTRGWVHSVTGDRYGYRKLTKREIRRLHRHGYNPDPDYEVRDHVAKPKGGLKWLISA